MEYLNLEIWKIMEDFIRLCLQNNGRLSARKRASHFKLLTKDEIGRMEEAVQNAYGLALQRNLMYIFLEYLRFIGYCGLKSQKGGSPYVAGDSPN
jgi:hypothetical protein